MMTFESQFAPNVSSTWCSKLGVLARSHKAPSTIQTIVWCCHVSHILAIVAYRLRPLLPLEGMHSSHPFVVDAPPYLPLSLVLCVLLPYLYLVLTFLHNLCLEFGHSLSLLGALIPAYYSVIIMLDIEYPPANY